MSRPDISMLMTVYNGGAYLKPAVESVLSSQNVAFEFVIVDNCSTDGSREYLNAISDPRVEVILNDKNLGQTGALNVGIDRCTAPFIARLDADDLTEPDRLAWQARALAADSDLALVGGQMMIIEADGTPQFQTRYPSNPEILNARMLIANCFDHSSVAFRKDKAIAVGCYPESILVSQDYALFSALMRAGNGIAIHDRLCARVRSHPDQIMGQELAEREKNETAEVIAQNLAWRLGQPPNSGLGRTVYRLMMGITPDGVGPGDPSAVEALNTIFMSKTLPEQYKAELAIYLLGGKCDGQLTVRGELIRHLLRSDRSLIFSRRLWMRLGRAILPYPVIRKLRKWFS